MHVGRTGGPSASNPLLRFDDGRPDGAVSENGRVSGCYVHGLFANDAQRTSWVMRLGGVAGGHDYEAGVDDVLDRLAVHLETYVDVDRLLGLAR
jgi:adenosylcobyric acid synthase